VDGDSNKGQGSVVLLVLSICLPIAGLGIIAVVVIMVAKLFRRRQLDEHGILDGRLELSGELDNLTDEKRAMQGLMRNREHQ
jgi:hypothetical protein